MAIKVYYDTDTNMCHVAGDDYSASKVRLSRTGDKVILEMDGVRVIDGIPVTDLTDKDGNPYASYADFRVAIKDFFVDAPSSGGAEFIIFDDYTTTIATKEGDPNQTHLLLVDGNYVEMSVNFGGEYPTYFRLSGGQRLDTELRIDGISILNFDSVLGKYSFNGVASEAQLANIANSAYSADTAGFATNSDYATNADTASYSDGAGESLTSHEVTMLSGELVLQADENGFISMYSNYGNNLFLFTDTENVTLQVDGSNGLFINAGWQNIELKGQGRNIIKYDWNDGDGEFVIGQPAIPLVIFPQHEANAVGLHKVLIQSQDNQAISYMTKAEFKSWLNS